jgi:hypothetical protein
MLVCVCLLLLAQLLVMPLHSSPRLLTIPAVSVASDSRAIRSSAPLRSTFDGCVGGVLGGRQCSSDPAAVVVVVTCSPLHSDAAAAVVPLLLLLLLESSVHKTPALVSASGLRQLFRLLLLLLVLLLLLLLLLLLRVPVMLLTILPSLCVSLGLCR